MRHPSPDPSRLPDDPRLLPGVPVLRRDAHHLQVGLAGRRVVLPDSPEVRNLLDRLNGLTGTAADRSPATALALDRLAGAGLLVERHVVAHCLTTYADGPAQRAAALATVHSSPADADARWAARTAARVRVEADPGDRASLQRVLGPAGVRSAEGGGDLVVLVCADEPAREELDRLQHDDVPHLLVRGAPDHVVVGPFVEPGRTACVRCLDAHCADEDPRWPLLLAQHAGTGAAPPRDPALWQLALAWAARDVLRWLDGEEPTTWSATVRLGADPWPQRRAWRRHPDCGCGWADLPAHGEPHQYSESSLPSIDRRCSREQVSQ